jgi:hypothetical protein
VLRGGPYEMGYARGMILKNEIRDWVKDFLFQLNVRSFIKNHISCAFQKYRYCKHITLRPAVRFQTAVNSIWRW